jgi:hypothetical protein
MSEPLEILRPRVGRGRLRAKRESGTLIELEDRSQWAIPPGHEIYTQHWSDAAEVTVVPGDFAGYPYDLINMTSGDRVPARYLGYGDPALGWSFIEG